MWQAWRKCQDLVLLSRCFWFYPVVCGDRVRNNGKIWYSLMCGCDLQCGFSSRSEMVIMRNICNSTNSYFRRKLTNLLSTYYLLGIAGENEWHCTSRYLCSRKYSFKKASAFFLNFDRIEFIPNYRVCRALRRRILCRKC